MENTRKMVLVPEENLAQLTMQKFRDSPSTTGVIQSQSVHGIDATLTRLDAEMNEILNSNTYKDEREKWTAYLAVLQRYLHYVDNDRVQQYYALMQKNKEQVVDKDRDPQLKHCLNDSVIIETVPAKFRNKAKHLLRRLHETSMGEFSWDSAGVVTIRGKPIRDSNIVDLVNDAMRARKTAKPTGRRLFGQFLRTIQTPREFVGNDELWRETIANSTLQETRSDHDGTNNNNNNISTSSEDVSDINHSDFYSGSEHSKSSPNRRAQTGSGRCNKKRRIAWVNLKL